MTAELVAHLQWSEGGRVSAARGACLEVLGRTPESLVGLPLTEALGVPPTRAAELSARSDPEGFARLMRVAERDIAERWRYYEELAGLERTAPQLPPHPQAAGRPPAQEG